MFSDLLFQFLSLCELKLFSGRGRRPVKSLVVGRPILLALEDIDGSPSFLEKALRFIEQYGVGVEGILRQSADVDDVDRRVKEYEQGVCTSESPNLWDVLQDVLMKPTSHHLAEQNRCLQSPSLHLGTKYES
jgi:hypothetical protein